MICDGAMSKEKSDWLLLGICVLLLVLVIDIALLVGAFSIQGFNIIYTNDNGKTTITLNGWSEIIVAIGAAIGLAAGIYVRLTRKK
jgi:hypothetical protein